MNPNGPKACVTYRMAFDFTDEEELFPHRPVPSPFRSV